jgi:hypothetical protein
MRCVISIAINHGGISYTKFGSPFIKGGRADTQLPTNLGHWKTYLYPLDGSHYLAISESGFLHQNFFLRKF